MLTFRKSVVAAVFIITIIFFLRSSPSSPSISVSPPGEESEKQQLEQRPEPRPEPRLEPQPEPRPSPSGQQGQWQQKLPGALIEASLRDRLRYQFPYDLEGKFPAYIWQTWKYSPGSTWFHSDLRPMEASWTEMHPDFVHEVVTDKTALHLVRYLYAAIPEIYEAYETLPMPILQADFFRYLILLARGGIYTDIDTWALQPAVDWLPDNIDQATIGLIIGIEADPDRPDWRDWYSRRVQFCQWTIQSKPGHPILREVVASITEEALRMKRAGILTKSKMDKTVVEFTGPAIWTDVILNYFNDPKYFHVESGQKNISYEDFTGLKDRKKVGDVAVLPITSFSPGVQQMGAEEPDHPLAFVKHEFGGTWKPENQGFFGS